MDIGAVVSWAQVVLWLAAIIIFIIQIAEGKKTIPTVIGSRNFLGTMIVLGMITTGVSLYRNYQRETVPTVAQWEKYIDDLRLVRGQTFANQEFELSGKNIVNCKFSNVTFVYDGKRPFIFDHNSVDLAGKQLVVRITDGPQAASAQLVVTLINAACSDQNYKLCLGRININIMGNQP